MAPPRDRETFLNLLRQNGLVDGDRLDSCLQRLRDTHSLPDTVGPLAAILVSDGVLTRLQAEQILLGIWRRFSVGKYQVLERLGTGGAFSCLESRACSPVVLKALPLFRAADPLTLQRFNREVRALADIKHRNLVRVYEVHSEGSLHCLVMEHVEGMNLEKMVRTQGPLTVAAAVNYLRQAATGLQCAYQATGKAHYVLNPENLLVDGQGTVKILNFGLANFFLDQDPDILVCDRIPSESSLNAADCLAPDSSDRGLSSDFVDIRSDIYSLGCTFYFCLTGQPAFPGGTTAQKLIWQQTRQPRPIREIRAEVPVGLAAILEKMLAKNPARRYQTPGAVAEVVSALPGLVRDSSPAARAWPTLVTDLAEALDAGEGCHFALCDALFSAGFAELGEHFRSPEQRHLKNCWALNTILEDR